MDENRQLLEAVQFLRKVIPSPVLAKIEPELKVLEDYVLAARPPRIALIGRRGSGKSSLVNAIFGDFVAETGAVLATTPAGTWYTYDGEAGAMEVLDTRGVGDGERPAGAAEEDAVAENMRAIYDRCPDVVLYTVKAADVDVWIDADMESLAALLTAIKRRHQIDVPVVGILTQVDVLDPADVAEPPFADPEKQANIQLATERLGERLARLLADRLHRGATEQAGEPVPVFATSAYMRQRPDRFVDRRWNIDKLVTYLVEQLPRQAQLRMVRLSQVKAAKVKLAKSLVQSVATMAGAVGATPIPVADIIPITGLQVAMVSGIAYLSGRKLTRHDVLEFLGAVGVNVGAATGLREFFRATVKLLPVAGGVASAGIAYWGTYAVGQAAIAYYIERQSIESARRVREAAQVAGQATGGEAAPTEEEDH